jgi:hypothetical protein
VHGHIDMFLIEYGVLRPGEGRKRHGQGYDYEI